MGFWAKAKGVFGRIGRGMKSGWDWLTRHKKEISDMAQTATDTFAPQYSDRARDIIKTGNDWMNKGQQFRQYLN